MKFFCYINDKLNKWNEIILFKITQIVCRIINYKKKPEILIFLINLEPHISSWINKEYIKWVIIIN